MKILKAKIRYNEQFSNNPDLQVLVDEIPNTFDANNVWQQHETCYFTEVDGYVNYFYYAKPDRGYAGRHFTITVAQPDGGVTQKVLIGPWSSRCSVMNMFFPHSMEVNITDDPEAFERGYTFTAGALTIPKVLEALQLIQGAALFALPDGRPSGQQEIQYVVTKLAVNSHETPELVWSRS